jgi:hypothetical protein
VLAGVVIFSFSAVLFKLSAAPPALGSTLRFAYASGVPHAGGRFTLLPAAHWGQALLGKQYLPKRAWPQWAAYEA